jgi:hypothetical protein
MIRRILNSLLANGLLFAAIMLHLLTAAITTLSVLIIAIVTKWINLKL